MKKTYIALAVLALAALVSCEQEKEINIDSLEKGEVGFYLRGSKATKAASEVATIKGETFELETDGRGLNLILEETITNLNAIAP